MVGHSPRGERDGDTLSRSTLNEATAARMRHVLEACYPRRRALSGSFNLSIERQGLLDASVRPSQQVRETLNESTFS